MKKTYKLENLDCATCAAKMELAIAKLDGVERANVSFLTQRLSIDVTDAVHLESILREVQSVCKKIEPSCNLIV